MRGQGNDVGHPGAIPSQILFWEVSPLEFNFYEFLPFDMGSNEVLPVERDYHVYWNGRAEGILIKSTFGSQLEKAGSEAKAKASRR